MATPGKRRATSVRLRRDDSRGRQVAVVGTEEQRTAIFETVPLVNRSPGWGKTLPVSGLVLGYPYAARRSPWSSGYKTHRCLRLTPTTRRSNLARRRAGWRRRQLFASAAAVWAPRTTLRLDWERRRHGYLAGKTQQWRHGHLAGKTRPQGHRESAVTRQTNPPAERRLKRPRPFPTFWVLRRRRLPQPLHHPLHRHRRAGQVMHL